MNTLSSAHGLRRVDHHGASTGTSYDETLVCSCLEGSAKAWEEFVRLHDARIRGTVSKTLSRHGSGFTVETANLSPKKSLPNNHHRIHTADTDDVVQEVYFRLVRSSYRLLSTWDPQRGSLSTWLIVVARSTTIDYLRTGKLFTGASYESIETYENTLLLSHSDYFAEESSAQAIRELRIPSGLLSPRQYSVVYLMVKKDMDTAEVARKLDIHPQTVRSVWHVSLAKLKSHYANQC